MRRDLYPHLRASALLLMQTCWSIGSFQVSSLPSRSLRHNDPDKDRSDHNGDDQSDEGVKIHWHASQTCCLLNSGFRPLTSASSAIQVCIRGRPTTSPGGLPPRLSVTSAGSARGARPLPSLSFC